MSTIVEDYLAENPPEQRRPDWRWQLVEKHFKTGTGSPKDLTGDADVELLADFVWGTARSDLCREMLKPSWRGVYTTCCLHTEAEPADYRYKIEAIRVGRMPFCQFAPMVGTGRQLDHKLYFSLFFDISPLDLLDDESYIKNAVLAPAYERAIRNPRYADCDLMSKLVAWYWGGQACLEFMSGVPQWTRGEKGRWIREVAFEILEDFGFDTDELPHIKPSEEILAILKEAECQLLGITDRPFEKRTKLSTKTMEKRQKRIVELQDARWREAFKRAAEIRKAEAAQESDADRGWTFEKQLAATSPPPPDMA